MNDAELEQALIQAMRQTFGSDTRRIDHALTVLGWAKMIRAAEGGDAKAVLAAAVLHDIGIQEAERKHGSSAGRFQEIEGPPIARKILEGLGMDQKRTEHVCRIVGSHHSARDINTLEFRILWDADWLVNIPDEYPEMDGERKKNLIRKVFKTGTGRDLALTELA
ncbi:MAG: HD domain-containing protein [Deltaproteobacteria bacterium]|nr:HD domain-containing protein [Deltaproteobacteria bacterium]